MIAQTYSGLLNKTLKHNDKQHDNDQQIQPVILHPLTDGDKHRGNGGQVLTHVIKLPDDFGDHYGK